jgi:hypothetical protein
MTHVDVGSLRFDSFTNVYDVDWNIPGYINRTIENDLKGRGGYSFIPLAANAPADWKQSMAKGIVSAVSSWIPGDLKSYLQRAAAENRLDVIVAASSYDTGAWQPEACFEIAKQGVVTKGYGLYTRTKILSGLSGLLPVGQNTASPYANIVVAVFQAQPGTLAAYAAAPCSKESLQDFPWQSDLQLLGPGVIKQVRAPVERLSAEAVKSALENAGLLP